MSTTAESFYEAIEHVGAGTIYYLTRKDSSSNEFIFEPLIIDTKNKELTTRILQRAMEQKGFIAFPGTPEMYEFLEETEDVGKPKNKQ